MDKGKKTSLLAQIELPSRLLLHQERPESAKPHTSVIFVIFNETATLLSRKNAANTAIYVHASVI